MDYKRILTIQDISCVGQCSLTVALPILSACGIETAIIPSAVLSTHTGGFTGFTVRDLSSDIPGIADHWRKEGIDFDAFYTGYLGSVEQIDMVLDIASTLGRPGAVNVFDPAMADNGSLYGAFDQAYVEGMKRLMAKGDYILPNITEAAFLADMPYEESYDETYVRELLGKLVALGAKNVVLTGVGYSEDRTGVVVYGAEDSSYDYYEHAKLPGGCHGTGDVYASVFTGMLLGGKTAVEAARIAADFTVECIEKTQGDPSHWYGVKFELAIPDLVKHLG